MQNGCAIGFGYPFVYSGGQLTVLKALGVGWALGINANRQVVGNTTGGPFLSSGSLMSSLSPAGLSQANAINDAGFIAAVSSKAQATVIFTNGTLLPVGTLGGATSVPTAMNAFEQVVGHSDTKAGSQHAFLYNGYLHDLGTLGGANSYATGINASGEVVGYSDLDEDTTHAFLFSGGFMLDLGTLGGPNSQATGINSAGQVVGYSGTAGGVDNAFIYSGGIMTALNSLLPAGSKWGPGSGLSAQAGLEQANAINDAGQIAGCAYVSGAYHGFLLTLTPNLTALSPDSAPPGGANFTLTVTGSNFIQGATVMWNTTPLATRYVSATSLTAAVPANLLALPGTATITVKTSQGVSPPLPFAIFLPRRPPGIPEHPRPLVPRAHRPGWEQR